MFSGFVIRGTAPKRVLLRAAGAALTRFGIAAPTPRPILMLFDGASRPLATNAGWRSNPDAAVIAQAAAQAGAFPLQENSRDAALLTTLHPGSYTVQVSGVNNTTGLAMVEVYDLP